MKRAPVVAVGVLLLVVASVFAPAPAMANNDPHRVFLEAGPLDLPIGYCDFPVHGEVIANNEYGKFTTLADGTVVLRVTGKFKVLLTNVTSGASQNFNISGPGTISFLPDGSIDLVATGRQLVYNLASDAEPFGLPGLMVASGRVTETLDADGRPTELSVTGKVTDVCAALS